MDRGCLPWSCWELQYIHSGGPAGCMLTGWAPHTLPTTPHHCHVLIRFIKMMVILPSAGVWTSLTLALLSSCPLSCRKAWPQACALYHSQASFPPLWPRCHREQTGSAAVPTSPSHAGCSQGPGRGVRS